MGSNEVNLALEGEIERYLKTGDYDVYYRAWPEGGMLLRAQKVSAAIASPETSQQRRFVCEEEGGLSIGRCCWRTGPQSA